MTHTAVAAERNPAPVSAAADPVIDAFVRWQQALAWDALPAPTRNIMVAELLDFTGAALAGRGGVGMPEWLEVLLVDSRTGRAGVTGGTTAFAPAAALANGYFGHVMELDDTHDEAVLHAGASAIPAALAAAEYRGGVSGKRLLEAMLAGIEMNCRLGVATDLSLPEGGWIYSSLLGHFGAALAASHVLGLSAAMTRNALGIAYCFACGNHQSSREGAPTKHVQTGIAAENGLKAALMASRGLSGVAAPITGEDGLARVYLHARLDVSEATAGLGTVFAIDRLSFKPYPSCRLTHPAISAALEMRTRLGKGAAGIERISVRMGRQAHDVVGRAEAFRLKPTRWLDAQFSVFWTVAVALTHGEVTPEHLLSEVPPTPAVADLIARMTAEPIAGSSARDVGGCELEVGGAFGTQRIVAAQAKGHPDNPLTEAEQLAKFCANARFAGISDERARALADGVLATASSADVSAVQAAFAEPIARRGRRAEAR